MDTSRNTNQSNDFDADLNSWLNVTADRYIVEQTLKESPYETTQIVYRRGRTEDELIGPFVRKRFVGNTHRGQAYIQLWRIQTMGKRLEHLPMVYECERTSNTTDVVMEFVHGKTLYEVAAQDGAGLSLAARIAPQLCDAVTQLHESFDQPLIHRDIKPSNVMVCNGKVMLIDLGIARTYTSGAEHDTTHYGTPGYAPPEQFGYKQTSTCSDIYALGMTIAFCLTGQDPTPELRERGFDDPRIPPELREVLEHATRFDPDHRHQSARELRDDFERAFEQASDKTSAALAMPATTAFWPGEAGGAFDASTRSTRRTRSDGARPRPHEAPRPNSLSYRLLHSRALTIVGRVWNVLVIWFYVMMSVATGYAAAAPTEANARIPSWFLPIMYVGLIYIPLTMAAYLLLDKRRLRKWRPFCRFTWKRELLGCLAIAGISMLATIALYGIASGL